MKKTRPRRNLASSAISVTALISMTLKIVQLKHRHQTTRLIQLTTEAETRSAPIVKSVRCLGTGLQIAMTMKPSDAIETKEH